MSDGDFDPEEHEERMGEYLSAQIERKRIQTAALNERLAEAHNIENRSAHQALLTEITGLARSNSSWPNLDPNNWDIPSDLTPWKEARQQIETVARACEQIIGVADTMDDLIFKALHSELEKKIPHHDLAGLFAAVRELYEAASSASAIQGQSGNRPLPEWMLEATRMCMAFWEEQRGEKPTAYFRTSKKPSRGTLGHAISGNNDFSKWFSDVMKKVVNVSPSTCETLVRKVAELG